MNIWTAIEKAGAQATVRRALENLGNTFTEAELRELEAKGIIGPAKTGAQHREVLDYGAAAPPVDE